MTVTIQKKVTGTKWGSQIWRQHFLLQLNYKIDICRQKKHAKPPKTREKQTHRLVGHDCQLANEVKYLKKEHISQEGWTVMERWKRKRLPTWLRGESCLVQAPNSYPRGRPASLRKMSRAGSQSPLLGVHAHLQSSDYNAHSQVTNTCQNNKSAFWSTYQRSWLGLMWVHPHETEPLETVFLHFSVFPHFSKQWTDMKYKSKHKRHCWLFYMNHCDTTTRATVSIKVFRLREKCLVNSPFCHLMGSLNAELEFSILFILSFTMPGPALGVWACR